MLINSSPSCKQAPAGMQAATAPQQGRTRRDSSESRQDPAPLPWDKSGFLAGKTSTLPFKLAKLNWPRSFQQGCPTLH